MDNPRVSYLFGNFFKSISIHLPLVRLSQVFLVSEQKFPKHFPISFRPFPNCIRISQIMIWVFHPHSFKIGSSNMQGLEGMLSICRGEIITKTKKKTKTTFETFLGCFELQIRMEDVGAEGEDNLISWHHPPNSLQSPRLSPVNSRSVALPWNDKSQKVRGPSGSVLIKRNSFGNIFNLS